MQRLTEKVNTPTLANFILACRMVEDLVRRWLRDRRSRNSESRCIEAEALYRRSLAIWEKTLGPEHPQVALGLNNLAELYRAQGKCAEAEALYRRALEIFEKVLGPEHPQVGMVLGNCAYLLLSMKRYTEAAEMEARAMSVRTKQARENLAK